MSTRYWAISKFTDWVKCAFMLPFDNTEQQWIIWEKAAKVKKFRYWLGEGRYYLLKFVGWKLNDFACWLPNIFCDRRDYFNSCWLSKSFSLLSAIERGMYYEFDKHLLRVVFGELVNFVEIKLAWIDVLSSYEDRKKCKVPWIFRLIRWRNAEAGLAYIALASELKSDSNYALVMQEIFNLYTWWKEERPKYQDPSEASGFNAYYDERQKAVKALGNGCLLSDAFDTGTDMVEMARKEKIFSVYHQIEATQIKKDKVMLMQLIQCAYYFNPLYQSSGIAVIEALSHLTRESKTT